MLQPANSVFQIAYVVRDYRAAVERWVRTAGAGPFFLTDHTLLSNPRYRGAPSRAEYAVLMGYNGALQIELVQPLNDAPSIYKETLDRIGEGYHHFMPNVDDFDAAVARYAKEGCEPAFTAGVTGVGRVVYLDGLHSFGGFIEIVEPSPLFHQMNEFMHAASLYWDGRDPIRSLPGA